MKTRTGTARNCDLDHATLEEIAEPVPVFISPGIPRILVHSGPAGRKEAVMFLARQGKELVISTENRPGVLHEMTKLLAERGISVLAVLGAVSNGDCLIRLVADDNLRAADALVEKGYDLSEQSVIILELPHKPGMLKRVAEVLATEEIDIHYLYASAREQDDKCLLIVHTENDDHALPRLNQLA